MSFRRVGWLAATMLGSLLWMSCGQVYRPVVIPVSTTPPNSENFHAVFGVSSNPAPNPGTVLQIDVAGDTNIGVANMGINPTHAAAVPNNSRVFVASAGSLIPGDPDIITAFTPAASSTFAPGITNPTVFSLPNVGPEQSAAITSLMEAGNLVTMTLSPPGIPMAAIGGPIVVTGNPIGGYDGNFTVVGVSGGGTQIQYNATTTGLPSTSGGTATVPLPTFCSYLPVYLATSQATNMYVANYGVENGTNCAFPSTDSVAQLNISNGTIANIAYIPTLTTAPHPVALAETPNAQHLYVVNQGDSTVLDLSPTDLSTIARITVDSTPVWAVARLDNQRAYVLSQGTGTVIPIDTATDTILPSQTNLSVGPGANFLLYDSHLNRLYVTNPTTGQVFVFSATGGVDLSGNANDTPSLLATISMTGGSNPPCLMACSPVSVTALPDGSRFYVASYELENSCADKSVGATACVVPLLTVFDAPSMTVKPAVSTLLPSPTSTKAASLSLLSGPQFLPTQYAVPRMAACDSAPTYTPGSTRFRMFATSSTDSSHVYVGMCDAGSIASVTTVTNTISQGTNAPDTLTADISAPFGACSGPLCNTAFPITGFSITGNVVTILTGQTPNNFVPGEQVQISGLTTGTYLNGQTLTVTSTGPAGTLFEANFTHSNVGATTDSGTALGLQVANITSFSINSNVVTFQAVNQFSPGTRVQISGLTSSAATSSGLNGQFLTVIATGLSNTQFECVLPVLTGTVPSTTDNGIAVPQVPPQTPIFLLPGS